MLSDLAANLTVGLALLVALVGLWRYRKLGQPLRLVALLVCFDAMTELLATGIRLFLPSNLFLFPFSLVGEGLLLTLAYRRVLASPRLKQLLLWVLGVYLLFVLGEAWRMLGTVQYFVTAQVVSNLYILGLALLYFRQLLNELLEPQLSRDPFFWVSVGLAGYALGNLFIALSSDYILTHYPNQVQRLVLRGVRNLFNIELYAAYLVALLLRPAPRRAA